MTNVQTPSGAMVGAEHGAGLAFRGIRYAEAPTGDRRFRPPVPVSGWSGTYDATDFGPAAPQNQEPIPGSPLAGALPPEPTDEDCLFLNVYTPACDDGARPVYVWIHGGAWVTGSGRLYDGSLFADEFDIVVVTINYRLGLLGWAPVDHLTDDAGFETAQNNGLLDQVCALEWVRDNIAAFGGDPARVTIGGESAGGGSVAALLATPAADGLFHQAIPQSPALEFGHPEERRDSLTGAIATALGAGPDDAWDRLRAAAPDEIIAATTVATMPDPSAVLELGRVDAPNSFCPTVDGLVMPSSPVDAVRDKGAANVPLLIGTNRHEGSMFGMMVAAGGVTDDQMTAAFGKAGLDPDAATAAYQTFRPGATAGQTYSDGLTESLFRNGVIRLADAQAAAAPTWVYLFTWETPLLGGALGSAHTLELFFQWEWAARTPGGGMAGDRAPLALGDHIRRLWASFIRDGVPAADGLPTWPRYDSDARPTLVIDEVVEVRDDPDSETRTVWA